MTRIPTGSGPPVIYAWVRFRDSPTREYLGASARGPGEHHWTVAAAMAPHRGVARADAHVTLSTGIVSAAVSFHDDAPLDEWFLYANSPSGPDVASRRAKARSSAMTARSSRPTASRR